MTITGTVTKSWGKPRTGYSMAELLDRLGNIPPDRVRMTPTPGTATDDDAIRINECEATCELIDGTIVEKPVSAKQDFFAAFLASVLMTYVRTERLGIVGGPRILFRMSRGNLLEPDVSFTSASRIVEPLEHVCEWCPDLCIEVLSESNTRREMENKRRDYFSSGCQLVWEFDRAIRTVTVFTDVDDGYTVGADGELDGGNVISGFRMPVAELFGDFHSDFKTPSDRA